MSAHSLLKTLYGFDTEAAKVLSMSKSVQWIWCRLLNCATKRQSDLYKRLNIFLKQRFFRPSKIVWGEESRGRQLRKNIRKENGMRKRMDMGWAHKWMNWAAGLIHVGSNFLNFLWVRSICSRLGLTFQVLLKPRNNIHYGTLIYMY